MDLWCQQNVNDKNSEGKKHFWNLTGREDEMGFLAFEHARNLPMGTVYSQPACY